MSRCRGISGVVRAHATVVVAALCAVVAPATTVLTATPASASQFHAFSSEFGGPNPEYGQLSLTSPRLEDNPTTGGSGIAVNDATDDVYVADTGNHRVVEFSLSGTFIRAFGGGVGGAGVNICTSKCKGGTSGAAPGELEAPNFIAVDNSAGPSKGDVYVATGRGRQALEEAQNLQINGASSGTFTLTFESQTTEEITYSTSNTEMTSRIEKALAKLSTIGEGNVSVGLEPDAHGGGLVPNTWRITFRHALADMNVPQITASPSGSGLAPAGASIDVGTVLQGSPFVQEIISKFDKDGNLVETWGNGGPGETPNGQLLGPSTQRFEPLVGLAVDASGSLWAYDHASQMFEFSQEGSLSQKWHGANNLPWGIAIDRNQIVYLPREGQNQRKLSAFDVNGGELYSLLFLPIRPLLFTGIAVDRQDDDLYVDEEGEAIGDYPLAACEPVPNNNRGCSATQRLGLGNLVEGGSVAVDSTTGTVYVALVHNDKIAAFPTTIEGTIEAVKNPGGSTATLEGKVNPEGAELTKCKLEYGTTTDYGKSVPCIKSFAEIGAGNKPVSVSANISGLAGDTTYHFRLHVSNVNGDVHSEDETFHTGLLPLIDKVEATDVTASSADLSAEINPKGLEASYDFEYGTSNCEQGGCTSVPVPAAPVGMGMAPIKVTQHLEGLKACTTYHSRVLVTTKAGDTITNPDYTFSYTTGCPEEITQTCTNGELRAANGSTTLPDCRAYEMVTPAYTSGFTVFGVHALFGPGVVVGTSNGAFAGAENNQQLNAEYEFTRESSGWKTTPLDPPAWEFPESRIQIEGFSPDLQSYVSQFGVAVPGVTPTPEKDFYLRASTGHLSKIGPATPPGTLGEEAHREAIVSILLGASKQLSHIVFSSKDGSEIEQPLWPFDETLLNDESLYEYTGTNKTAPVMVAVTGGAESHELVSQCGSSLGGGTTGSRYNAVSNDGKTIFFSAVKGGCKGLNPLTKEEQLGKGPPVEEIYARIDGERTVAISEPSHGDCEECQEGAPEDATYLAASEDGSKVLFSTNQKLLPSDTDSTTDIYEYNFAAPSGHKLVQVTAGGAGDMTPGTGAEAQGIMTVTPDLSSVFFVAKGALSGENAEHNSPTEGDDNLYVYNSTDQSTGFIATLAPGACDTVGTCIGDAADWSGFSLDVDASVSTKGSRVTPDGRYLLFPSAADLTADDSSSATQLFQYDAQKESLRRVSVGQHGYNDNGNGSVAIASDGGFQSTDGTSVFFESAVPLVPQAAKSVGFNNVYEWEANGAGSCTQTQGCVYLISDGHDTHSTTIKGSTLVGASPSGADVYFQTVDSLTASDTNTQEGIYDARVNGGFPATVEPVVCNSSEACQGAQSAAPLDLSPFTFTFSSPGNIAPSAPPTMTVKPKKATVQCARGKKLSRGKCVKVKAKHKRSKARSKGKAKKARKVGSGHGTNGNRRAGR